MLLFRQLLLFSFLTAIVIVLSKESEQLESYWILK